MLKKMIGCVGLSHLGIVSCLAVAAKGFEVVGYDLDDQLCANLTRGEFPIYEPGLAELYGENVARVRFSASPADLAACDVVYLSLDIHTDERGRSDLAALEDLFAGIADSLPDQCSLVVMSQVPPGFTRRLCASYRELLEAKTIQVYYQVETLVFGAAVARALQPERIIVGCVAPELSLRPYYADLLAAFDCPVLPMRYESAELAKISINVCLASAISAANTLAELCEAVGADWYEIMPALRSDRRIGPHAYLTPGLGIGGGNLDRDLVTVCRLGREMDTHVEVVEACRDNSRHRGDWALENLRTEAAEIVGSPVVAVWGLAYKAGTQSTKNSPALHLIASAADCEFRYFDPQVTEEVSASYGNRYTDPLDACLGADILAIMTPWDQFSDIDLAEVSDRMRRKIIIDPYRAVNGVACRDMGFKHIVIGASARSNQVGEL